MTTYFIGDELECYAVYSDGITESTTGSMTGYSRGTVYIPDSSSEYVEAQLSDSVTGLPTSTNGVLWLHFRADLYYARLRTFISFSNASGVEVLRLSTVNTGTSPNLAFQINVDGTWTNIITNISMTNNSYSVYDFKIIPGLAGSIECYRQGVKNESFEGDLSSVDNISKLTIRSAFSDTNFHQLIIADYSTINHTIRRRTPTGNGTTTQWAGDYSLIDDAPSSTIGSDAITADSPELVSTFTSSALTATTAGHVIKAVAVAEFSRNDGTGQTPQNVRQILVVDGVQYEAPVNAPIDAGWRGGVAFWENNPSTGASWANIDAVNSTEFGIKSKD